MQNPIGISYVNIFLFIVYILLQYLLYTAVNYNGYLVRESKRNALPAGKRTNFFDGFVAIKNKIKVSYCYKACCAGFNIIQNKN